MLSCLVFNPNYYDYIMVLLVYFPRGSALSITSDIVTGLLGQEQATDQEKAPVIIVYAERSEAGGTLWEGPAEHKYNKNQIVTTL